MSIYGIELLKDNITECRKRMLEVVANFLKIKESDEFYRAASYVLLQNLIHGDALRMRTAENRPIIFAEWEYLGSGKFRRRDFRFDSLTQTSVGDKHEKFAPMTIGKIARASTGGEPRKTV